MISQACQCYTSVGTCTKRMRNPQVSGKSYGLTHLICKDRTCQGRLRSISRQGAGRQPLDEPSGLWQAPCWLDPGSVALTGELDSFLPESDSPALDYVMRYPAPVDDDVDDPAYGAAAAAVGAVLGPDMHGPLEPASDVPGSGRRTPSLIEQLRQRALSGSSSDEDEHRERDWQSMDIPALLLSPHHAAALYSLSSAEEEPDLAAAPDFADLALAREADRAAQAAAELVPPELRPLARAANLLGYHHDHGHYHHQRGGPGQLGDAPEPGLELQAGNRFSGVGEPLTDEQLEAVAMLVAAADCDDGGAATGPCAVANPLQDPAVGDCGCPTAPSGATVKKTSAAVAAAVALAEEGVEWLDAARPAAAAAAAAGAAAPASAAPSGSQRHLDLSIDLEDRSVQLRREPHTGSAEQGLDEVTRARVAREVAMELAEADASIVHHDGTRESVGAAALTHGSRNGVKRVSVISGDAGGERMALDAALAAAAMAAADDVADAGGRTAADEAAAAVAAEARRAVWGEGGWPYSGSMQSADIVEKLKHSIHQQQQEADQGSTTTLLP